MQLDLTRVMASRLRPPLLTRKGGGLHGRGGFLRSQRHNCGQRSPPTRLAECGREKGWPLRGHGGFAAVAATLPQGLLSTECKVCFLGSINSSRQESRRGRYEPQDLLVLSMANDLL